MKKKVLKKSILKLNHCKINMSSEEKKVRKLVLIDLKTMYIEFLQENDNIVMIEKWSGEEDTVEAELGSISENALIEEILKRLNDEFKLPKSITGELKARLKRIGFPITIRLIEQERTNTLDVKGRKGSFQLVIRYQIV